MRGSVQLGSRAVDSAELRGRGLGGNDCSGLTESLDLKAVVRRDAIGKYQRRLCLGPAVDFLKLLDAHRNAAKGE